MSKLQAPIHEQLDSHVPEADVRRLWLGIGERRQRLARRRSSLFRRPVLLGAFAATAALLLLALLRPPGLAGGTREASLGGPLLKVDGEAPLSLGGKEPDRVALEDGSRIALQGGAKLEVIDNDGKRFVSALRSGTARFEVKPGGLRRWTIEAGLASIEVVGTAFTVRRSEREVEVMVSHGTVIVRGQYVLDHVQRLSAGERLLVSTPGAETPPPVLAPPPSAPEQVPAVEVGATRPLPSQHDATTTELRADQRVAHFLAQADRARRAGDVEQAIALLRKALADAEGSQAALTSFTLGKLLLDSAGRPSEAEQAFARCLALGPPTALAEDALARLVEAQAKARRVERARATAAEYERLYPSGRRLAEVRRWSAGL